jgi:hypothetical protein
MPVMIPDRKKGFKGAAFSKLRKVLKKLMIFKKKAKNPLTK